MSVKIKSTPLKIFRGQSFIVTWTLFLFFHFGKVCPAQTTFEEKDGFLEVEAEAFHQQILDDVRKWYVVDKSSNLKDAGEAHFLSASGESYIEVLPDTRKTHDDKLIHGENFTNEPGKMAVINYHVKFNTLGRYYVWVRAFSTGTEDNGLHVGLDGNWVESGQRMQWCDGKNQWSWASKQRTQEVHCGVERLIYLDVAEPGMHTVSFSMREDGFEFDKWVMSMVYEMPK